MRRMLMVLWAMALFALSTSARATLRDGKLVSGKKADLAKLTCGTLVPEGSVFTLLNATSTTDCTTAGSGSSRAACTCQNGSWVALGGGGGGSGTVTSVAVSTPAGFAVSGSPITVSGTAAISYATGQTSHRVLGTCGSATVLSLCALGLADLPTDWSLATQTITGAGTASRCARFDASHHLVEFSADCTSGGSGTVTSVTCGTGLTGGAITASGTCAVDFGTGSTQAATGNSTTNGPEGAEYNPDRKPSSGLDATTSDEFTSGENGSWSWWNQGAATVTNELGTSKITGSSTSAELAHHGRCQTPPAGTDWTITAKVSPTLENRGAANGEEVGIAVVDAGTQAAPTSIRECGLYWSNQNRIDGLSGSTTSLTTGFVSVTTNNIQWINPTATICMQARYVSATKVFSCYYATDCTSWQQIGTASITLTNAPVVDCRFVNNNGNPMSTPALMRLWWWRVRTDVTGTTEPYPAGS